MCLIKIWKNDVRITRQRNIQWSLVRANGGQCWGWFTMVARPPDAASPAPPAGAVADACAQRFDGGSSAGCWRVALSSWWLCCSAAARMRASTMAMTRAKVRARAWHRCMCSTVPSAYPCHACQPLSVEQAHKDEQPFDCMDPAGAWGAGANDNKIRERD